MDIFKIITTIFEWIVLFIATVIVLPAMWVMAYFYPTWEKWIKDNDNLVKKWERLLLIIPLTILVLVALIIYRLFHKWFEDQIKAKWGLKLF